MLHRNPPHGSKIKLRFRTPVVCLSFCAEVHHNSNYSEGELPVENRNKSWWHLEFYTIFPKTKSTSKKKKRIFDLLFFCSRGSSMAMGGQEWELYLENVSTYVEDSQVLLLDNRDSGIFNKKYDVLPRS